MDMPNDRIINGSFVYRCLKPGSVRIKISLNFSDFSELPIFGNNHGYRAWEGGWPGGPGAREYYPLLWAFA
jgi:hypothetical protein